MDTQKPTSLSPLWHAYPGQKPVARFTQAKIPELLGQDDATDLTEIIEFVDQHDELKPGAHPGVYLPVGIPKKLGRLQIGHIGIRGADIGVEGR